MLPDGRVSRDWFWNRCHLLAKSLGGEERRENLVTGTRMLNVGASDGQGGMDVFEAAIRGWLAAYPDVTVQYVATPAYEGTEPIPRSVLVDVLSSDGRLDERLPGALAAGGGIDDDVLHPGAQARGDREGRQGEHAQDRCALAGLDLRPEDEEEDPLLSDEGLALLGAQRRGAAGELRDEALHGLDDLRAGGGDELDGHEEFSCWLKRGGGPRRAGPATASCQPWSLPPGIAPGGKSSHRPEESGGVPRPVGCRGWVPERYGWTGGVGCFGSWGGESRLD